jgi:hypothetical protein
MGHTIQIEYIDQKDPRLGRHVEHDSRSLQYAVAEPRKLTQKDVFHEDAGPILDQGQLGACVGFTGADILNTTYFANIRATHNSNNYFNDDDGMRFYHDATVSDNISGTYPPDDTGSSGLGLAKALKTAGLISSYKHVFSWAQFQAAIAKQPVALGTLWTNSMFKPDKNGVVKVGSLSNSNIAGGHEYMARGISYTRGLVLCRNHWNTNWDTSEKVKDGGKVPGEFWVTFADLQKLLANQGDCTVLNI